MDLAGFGSAASQLRERLRAEVEDERRRKRLMQLQDQAASRWCRARLAGPRQCAMRE